VGIYRKESREVLKKALSENHKCNPVKRCGGIKGLDDCDNKKQKGYELEMQFASLANYIDPASVMTGGKKKGWTENIELEKKVQIRNKPSCKNQEKVRRE